MAAPARAELFGGYKLEVKYGSNAADGKLMTKAATSVKPTLKFPDAETGTKYTLSYDGSVLRLAVAPSAA